MELLESPCECGIELLFSISHRISYLVSSYIFLCVSVFVSQSSLFLCRENSRILKCYYFTSCQTSPLFIPRIQISFEILRKRNWQFCLCSLHIIADGLQGDLSRFSSEAPLISLYWSQNHCLSLFCANCLPRGTRPYPLTLSLSPYSKEWFLHNTLFLETWNTVFKIARYINIIYSRCKI